MARSRPGSPLRHSPSLPSLLSNQRIKARSTSASPVPDNASIIQDVFAPTLATETESFDESSLHEFSGGDVRIRDETLQHKLHEQLARNERQRLKRQASTSGTPTKSKLPPTRSQTPTLDSPTHRPRRYFILTSAGKPVYASDDEDEELVTSSVGVMQAIISIFADDGDRIRYINAGNLKIAFMLKAPLYYVCLSDFGEPESVLRTHLEYLHLYIISVISLTQLQRVFAQRYNFDLRRLLEGTDAIMANLISRLQYDFALMTGSLEPAPLKQSARDEIGKHLIPSNKSKDILYAAVISQGRVVTLLRPKRHSVHPSDLHLLINTIYASPSLTEPGNETWIPVCLPKFNNSGFVHALITFVEKEIGFIFISTDKEAFFSVREWKERVVEKLESSFAMKTLRTLSTQQRYSIGELSIAGLRHFLYRSKVYVQVTSTAWEGVYEDEQRRTDLITLYQRMYSQVHARPTERGFGRQPAKLIYLHTEHEAVLCWTTSTFELYIALAPLLPKTAAVAAAHGVIKWIKSRESELFLLSAPSF